MVIVAEDNASGCSEAGEGESRAGEDMERLSYHAVVDNGESGGKSGGSDIIVECMGSEVSKRYSCDIYQS